MHLTHEDSTTALECKIRADLPRKIKEGKANLIKTMGAIVEAKMEAYKSDFYTHDVEWIKEGAFNRFLWAVHKYHTHITPFRTLTDIPPERVGYLFGTCQGLEVLELDENILDAGSIREGNEDLYICDIARGGCWLTPLAKVRQEFRDNRERITREFNNGGRVKR